MAKKLTDLTARTATADSDLIHVNSGGVDYKETKENFSANLAKWVDFGNSSSLTAQIDALAGDCAYEGIILSYGHQSETGVPTNANFYVDVIKIASGAGRVKIYALNASAKPVSYINFKSGGTWQGWVQDPTRDEITSLNTHVSKCYIYTSSTGFQAACPSSWGSAGLGGVLDLKVKNMINSYTNETINHITGSNSGAVIAIILFKLNNNYYSGLAFTYHTNPIYTGDGIVAFKYDNDKYRVYVYTPHSDLPTS